MEKCSGCSRQFSWVFNADPWLSPPSHTWHWSSEPTGGHVRFQIVDTDSFPEASSDPGVLPAKPIGMAWGLLLPWQGWHMGRCTVRRLWPHLSPSGATISTCHPWLLCLSKMCCVRCPQKNPVLWGLEQATPLFNKHKGYPGQSKKSSCSPAHVHSMN